MGDAIGKEVGGLISEGVLPIVSSWSVIRSPCLSSCHRCGLGFPINGSVDCLKALESQWRVVLLCRECFAAVKSAEVCSYCFLWFPELEKGFLDCNMCSRRVHRTCVTLHHRNFSHTLFDADNFICVDCCPIPKLRREDSKSSGGSTSRTTFSVSLDDFVEGATSISEKKETSKGKARENEAKKVLVTRGSSELKRKAFDAVHLVKESSCVNLIVPDEKMALSLHQTINGSQRISRSLCPKGVSQVTVPRKEQCSYNSAVRIIDSNSCAHHGKINVSTENKSLQEDIGVSESILTNSPLFRQENSDLTNQVRGCTTGYPDDVSLNEMEGSLKFPNCADDGSNSGLALLPCHSLNTSLKSTMPLTKSRFDDCDGESSYKLQRKSIDLIGLNGSLKKYFRKSWCSGRIMRENSHSIFSSSPLFKQENGDPMKQHMICGTDGPSDFTLQEKESSQRFPDSIDDRSNSNSTLLPCHSMNAWLIGTSPAGKHRFGDCDKLEYSKLKRRSTDVIGLDRPMKKYFRKHWDSGRTIQGSSHPILTNNPIFKQNNTVLMKRTRECNIGCSGDFSLKDKESSLKFPDSTEYVKNSDSALLPHHSLNTLSNSSMALTKYRFGDGDGGGSSKLQRKSIDAMACRSMKKYFRKHWSSIDAKVSDKKGNSESILVNSPLFNENEDLTKQTRGCNTGNIGIIFSNEEVSSLQFPDYTNDGSNAGSALFPCHSLNSGLNNTFPLTNHSFCDGDGERSKKLQRKPIDAIVSNNMKKYYRKRWGSKRIMHGTSQSMSISSSLINQENGDLMKQNRECNTICPRDFPLKEEISLKFPDSTDDGSNIDSALLQFHSLNTSLNITMPLIKYTVGDEDGVGYSKLQRRSIDTICSDASLKKYFRRNLGS
ncbi:hypothetical protein KFK09_024616 [Dendrobium nobile]|uniref:C2H2-type domain-containing protein n=1 Tax=Dendrobium nobile TaxID=94219 RepID=A0A8T3AEA9_DENNO|nr:hypothetical protein KFK09_024616 [Dendrobium nobile]